MRVTRFLVCVAMVLLAAALPGRALDWPVQKRIITGTFGQDRGGRFSISLDIGGGEQDVRAILPGEEVFRYDENDLYTSLPRGLGSFIVMHHEGNIQTVFSALKKGSLGPQKEKYAAADRIGTSGDSGYSDGVHLQLTVYDEESASFVNPLSLLPSLMGAQQPVIRKIFLTVGDSTVPLDNGAQVPAGKAEVVAQAYDLRGDVRFLWPLGLYGARLSVDGKEVSKIVFDSLQAVNGRLCLGAGKLPVTSVYTRDGLLRCGSVELHAGASHLILSVRDFAGNETTKEFSFTVRQ